MTDREQKDIFARNLLKYVELSGKTQLEIAKSIGVSPQTFNTWITGKALPRMGKVQLLADYFGIKKTDLIDDKSTNEDDSEEYYYTDPETRRAAQELYDNEDLRVLFDAAQDSKPEDLQMAADLLRRLKRTNPDG